MNKMMFKKIFVKVIWKKKRKKNWVLNKYLMKIAI